MYMKLSVKVENEEFLKMFEEDQIGSALADLKSWALKLPEGAITGCQEPVYLNYRNIGNLQPSGSISPNGIHI